MVISFNNKPLMHELPPIWIYTYLCEFNVPFDGRTITIRSPFTNEKTPSCKFYAKNGRYYWKDFSSGEGGDELNFAKVALEAQTGSEWTYKEILKYLRDCYKHWQTVNGGPFITPEFEHSYGDASLTVDYCLRSYTQEDYAYFDDYNINSALLEEYYIHPLEWFKLTKKYGEQYARVFPKVIEPKSYGMFTSDYELLKVYNPESTALKHVTVKNDVLGREQLQHKEVCIIGASMKDILALKSLNLPKVDVLAPPSEKTLIPKSDISYLKNMYGKNLFTMFDNDPTGIRAMHMYRNLFDIDFMYLPLKKDVAEYVKSMKNVKALETARAVIALRIDKKINK